MNDINYFVCTLGQAARLCQKKQYESIPEFIDHHARELPDVPAVGFYTVKHATSGYLVGHVHDFKTIQQGVRNVAKILRELGNLDKQQTIALLCPSSAAFLYSWLALIYLGHAVLLIAPQCSPSAIAHLCKECDVSVLLYEQQYDELAGQSASEARQQQSSSLKAYRLPFGSDAEVVSLVQMVDKAPVLASNPAEADIAYLHHTSGTSTGLPKPIPQSHQGGLGVLPCLDGTKHATFTTTPLYHGGVADLFRAWTSNALMWIFPGKDLPTTPSNIMKCLNAAEDFSQTGNFPPVKYFSSVPYVLQMIAANEHGLDQLRTMDLVGVGGAALPKEVGDDVVRRGVSLVSRFGSAECGFLLSSDRQYIRDKEWQYLRLKDREDQLVFEDRGEGLHELIIKSGWPHMAKRNRDDGSYATSDLFEAHPSMKNAWRYHSRADSQLTLITGKKFDPAPIEAALVAATSSLDDVLIFGNGRPYPGALLFRSEEKAAITDAGLLGEVAPHVEKLNAQSQGHARISQQMLFPMPRSDRPLEKSSKGTVMRRKAEEKYTEVIDAAYQADTKSISDDIPDMDVPSKILDIVSSALSVPRTGGGELTVDSDLFAAGLDSVASIRIRQSLSSLLSQDSSKLPLNVVEDTGTVSRLSELVVALRHGKNPKANEDQLQLMQRLVQQYSASDKSGSRSGILHSCQDDDTHAEGLNVLMTGPTGSLGSHLLYQLLHSPSINHIYLLVRGASPHAARERVLKALTLRRLLVPSDFDLRVSVLPCKLSSPDLGLRPDQFQELVERVDVIAHLAWAVNFLLPLRAFASHLSALQNLINFASSSSKALPPRFIFCSTVAAVSQHAHPIPETIVSDDASVSGPTGYARSKWVAEQVCLSAYNSTRLRGGISAVRVGQLSGAADTGVWANSEAYPMIMSTFQDLACLPDLDAARKAQSHDGQGREDLNWLPVDIAAKAFADLILLKKAQQDLSMNRQGEPDIDVYHLLPPPRAKTASWSDLVRSVSEGEKNSIKLVSVDAWLDKLEDMGSQEPTKDHPALRLVSFWRDAYCTKTSSEEAVDRAVNGDEAPTQELDATASGGFAMTRTLALLPALRDYHGLDEEYILKIWQYIMERKST